MVSYIMELQVVSKENIRRVILLFAINLFYAFISMGKMNFMILFLSSAIILTQRKIVKLWHLAIGVVVLLFLFVGIQTIRGSYTTPKHFAALYLTSSLGNFNTNLKPESAEQPGENTFRLYYAVKSAFDGGRTQPVDPVLDFKRVDVGEFVYGSNTYTTLYPFYKDFGQTGVIVFAVILGLIFGYLFKTSEDGSDFSLVLYAILAGTIVMQFIGDTFFTVLSQNIQYLVAALLPFIISKFNLFTNLIKRNG
jgi:oligosaccharide repeat unit polymerase